MRCILELGADERVVLLGEDIGREGGVFRVTEGPAGLLRASASHGRADCRVRHHRHGGGHGHRGAAAGAGNPVHGVSLPGLRPAHQPRGPHAQPFARAASSARLVVRVPYGGGIHPPEHHSESTEAMLVHTPGLQVVVPATPYDAKGLLISAIRSPDPVIFLEPKRIYRAVRQEIPEDSYTVPIGEARLVRAGTDVTVIAWGSMMHTVLQAAESLDADGISAEILDLRTLSPMDVPAIIASVEKNGAARGGGARSSAYGRPGRRDRGADQRGKPCCPWRPRSSASAALTPYSPCRSSKSITCRPRR